MKNSIVIDNRNANSSETSSDPNLALKNGAKEYCFGYYTLTSFTGWRIGSNNPEYNADVSPFRRNYNFDTKTQGDYQLDYTIVPTENNPAIGRGQNSDLNLKLYPYDFYGRDRLCGDAIDLGACEYHPSSFDYAFPTDCQVQTGCSFELQCEGTDTQGSRIVQYNVDLNGDGITDKSGSHLFISWDELSCCLGGKGYFWLAMVNALGETSDSRQVEVSVAEVLPSIGVSQCSFCYNQAVKLHVSASGCGCSIQQWIIDWGDQTTPTQYDYLTRSVSASHYYVPGTKAKTYSITLRLIDSEGRGDDIVYHVGAFTIAGSGSSSAAIDHSVSVENSATSQEIIPLEPETAIDSDPTCPILAANAATDASQTEVLFRLTDAVYDHQCGRESVCESGNGGHFGLAASVKSLESPFSLATRGAQLAATEILATSEDEYEWLAKVNLGACGQVKEEKLNNELDIVFTFFDHTQLS